MAVSPIPLRNALVTVVAVAGTTIAAPVVPAATAAAAGGAPVVGASAPAMTTAERCDAERVDVRRAKRALAKAKAADKRRAAKVARAKQRLEKQKRQRAKWCTAARREADAAAAAGALGKAWSDFRSSAEERGLPPEVHDPLVAAIDEVVALTETLTSERIPGADAEELAMVVDLVTGLAPGRLRDGVVAFALKLDSATDDPDALAALVAALLGPDAATLPGSGDGAQLQEALEEILAALEAFDPNGGSVALSRLVIAIERATEKLQSSATGLDKLFAAYGDAAGGTAPHDEATWTAMLTALLVGGELPFPLPTDVDGLEALDHLLNALTGVLGDDVPLPGAEQIVAELLDDLTDGGVDLQDVVEVVDPGGIIGGVVGGVVPEVPILL